MHTCVYIYIYIYNICGRVDAEKPCCCYVASHHPQQRGTAITRFVSKSTRAHIQNHAELAPLSILMLQDSFVKRWLGLDRGMVFDEFSAVKQVDTALTLQCGAKGD